MFVGALLVSVRVGEFVSGVDRAGSLSFGGARSQAQTDNAQTDGGAKSDAGAGKAPADNAASTDMGAGGAQAGGEGQAETPPALKDPTLFSATEIQILQRLAERRDELDAREKALAEREKLLKAFEARIDEQLAALKESEGRVQGLLKAYDEQEAEKMRSLVKIYETMKPVDAARIFEKLDNKVLLEVLQNMKTTKSAPIFAAMNPVLAREMTQALAERSKLPREGGEENGTTSTERGRQ